MLSFISTRLIIQTFNTVSYSILNRYLNQGESILNRYLAGELNSTELADILDPEMNLNLAYVILLDENHEIIAASTATTKFVSFSMIKTQAATLQAQSQFITTGQEQSEHFSLLIGRPVFRDQTRIGSVFAGFITTEAIAARSQYNINIFTVIWPLFIIFLFLSLLATRRFIRPIKVLAEATRSIAGGKWGTTIDPALPGEMGSLAEDFNAMSLSLAGTIDSLNYEKNSMKLMLEGLQEGIVAMDGQHRILHQNGAALALLRGTGSEWYRHLIAGLEACVRDGQSLSGKSSVRGMIIEYVIRRIPAEKSDGKQTTGAIALIRDVTASERLEQTRRDYVANISHELRTPLTAMRGLIEPLQDGLVQDEGERRRCYNMIAEESLRLSRLVNDLLELSGIQTQTAAFETERIDTTDLVQDVYYRNRQLFSDASLKFELNLPDALPVVCTNEDRIIQVLTIFLDNARKYTPTGGKITLGAVVTDQAVRISVSDTGIGMDEATREHIFDRFYQGDPSRHDRGNGLGLAIAREILNQLSIPLEVVTAPGKGSTFTLTLPLAAA